MPMTVTRLFDSYPEASRAIEELERMGVPSSRISLVANNQEKHVDHDGDGRQDGDDDGKDAGNTKRGVSVGGVLGGGAGLAAGLGALAIPGVGPVVAAGWLAATAAGAVAGAVGGGVTGGIIDALKNSGHSDEEAHVYAEGVRRGGAVVSVQAESSDEAARVEETFQRLEGVDAQSRGDAYRQSGWSRFDESSPEYSREEMERERDLYRSDPTRRPL